MIRRDGVQKSAGISGKRRARRRSVCCNWSFGDFCRHSCVRSTRYLLERFLPRYALGEKKKKTQEREREERSEPAKCTPVLARSHGCAPLLLLAAIHSPHARARAPLSFSLIEYSPLYLRMPVEIYRRSRCPFRFNLLQRRPLFPFSCSPLHRLMLFPSLLYFPPSSSSSFALSSTLPPR